MPDSEALKVKPEIIEWACARSGRPRDELRANFPHLDAWIDGTANPAYGDLKAFADATYTGFGCFFSDEPPCDELPIPDLRRCAAAGGRPPSPHLLQMVYDCQFRQAVYADHILATGAEGPAFAGAAQVGGPAARIARQFSESGGFKPELLEALDGAGSSVLRIADAMRGAGALVFFAGDVGADAARPLDPEEFHCIALADPIAPAIFINDRCSEAEQMCMLAHGFARLIAGESGVSDASAFDGSAGRVERWCAELARELLIPLGDLRELGLDEERDSPAAERGDLLERLGRRYARAVVCGIRAGAAGYTDIDYLLGIRGLDLFEQLASEVGLAR